MTYQITYCMKPARKTMKKTKSEGATLPMTRLALSESLNPVSTIHLIIFGRRAA